MRLIDAQQVKTSNEIRIYEYHQSELPPYAILSHAWGHQDQDGNWGYSDQEIIFEDREKRLSDTRLSGPKYYDEIRQRRYDVIDRSIASDLNTSFQKIRGACVEVCTIKNKDGNFLEFLWIDTVCIDKLNSVDLARSITSMFKWYQNSAICIVYLADLDLDRAYMDQHGFQNLDIRWFKRGWTLQELVAPPEAFFYDKSWDFIGERSSRSIAAHVRDVTGIDRRLLRGESNVEDYSVAQRMSWAADRETNEPEDRAYSLQGMFGVNMAPMYGEGGDEAFLRLQQEIIKTTSDLSIFAWGSGIYPRELPSPDQPSCLLVAGAASLFAANPSHFKESRHVKASFSDKHFTLTNNGVEMSDVIFIRKCTDEHQHLILSVGERANKHICICLRTISEGVFQRQGRYLLEQQEDHDFTTYTATWYIALGAHDYREKWARDCAIQMADDLGARCTTHNPVPQDAWNYAECYFHNSQYWRVSSEWRALQLNVLLPNSNLSVTLAVVFNLKPIINDDDIKPKLYLFDVHDHHPIYSKIFSRKRMIQTDKWTDLLADVPGLEDFGHTVDVEAADGQRYFVTTQLTKTPRGKIAMYTFDIGIRTTDRYLGTPDRATRSRSPATSPQGTSSEPNKFSLVTRSAGEDLNDPGERSRRSGGAKGKKPERWWRSSR